MAKIVSGAIVWQVSWRQLLAIAVMLPAITIASSTAPAQENSMPQLPVEGQLPSFAGAVEWLNSKPLTPAELRGKVVLVDFWTYTCVNWTRTLPYVRAWAEKYKDRGLKKLTKVSWAIRDMRVDYPVAVDSNYAIWNAFRNEYWPAEYFVDTHGRIRHHHFGEGAYDESERVIQELLVEAGHRDIGHALVSVDPRGLEVAADSDDVRSPETYLGDDRTINFASSGGAVLDERHVYVAPGSLGLNHWAARGGDVDSDGYGTVVLPRTYQLIRQPRPIVDRQFEIEFFEPGVEAFDFTFG